MRYRTFIIMMAKDGYVEHTHHQALTVQDAARVPVPIGWTLVGVIEARYDRV